ncbi:MAG: thioredoxin fold domain-containing protein [Gammaproteobacteria bacterium]|nr:thioredoxin fold domain-containing protein [Gammaproteobacteria bacterium]
MNQTPKLIAQCFSLFLLVTLNSISNDSLVHADTATSTPNKPGVILGGKISEHPDWFKESFLDITEDLEEAAESNKHVMLFFHMNGCPYCYKMAEENIKNAPYTDFIKANFDVISLNVQGDREVVFDEETTLTEKELSEKLKIIYTPAVIFFDKNNEVVARVNGYRGVEQFKHVLDYVQQGAYQKLSLAQYVAQKKNKSYAFLPHPQLIQSTDLSATNGKPLAVLFESKSCTDCTVLHKEHLNDPEVIEVLKSFNFVRFDAESSEKMIDTNGKETTPQEFAKNLKVSYHPTLVLFDKGKEILRIESQLYRYHFIESLRYVGERHYIQYPDSVFDYVNNKTEKLLQSGQDVNIGE